MKKNIVISVGGSLIAPSVDKIDYLFLKKLLKLINEKNNKYRFILVAGGGKIARNYINNAKKVTDISDTEADWLGIAATRLNANLLKAVLSNKAYKEIIQEPSDNIKTNKILVAGGYKPGRSSDDMAVSLAIKYNAETVINMTNIDYVYDKDPSKYKDAEKIKEISWNKFLDIIGRKWLPGKNTPFDPIASKLAQKNNINVVILNGKKINNLKNYLSGDNFKGTVIGKTK
ncbi:UMP kinase [Patescibacteria group bacterium]|nr:UMP kinase [Patescibacteria group bacterium]